ncbi:helicase associated domain-containing protein [Streptomyces massasporeus]|uniref:helicase associated domain-containing protein n=1 Tax=Streptomyces massasporeus TaxID=67324 RepID=UPI003F5163A6
MAPGAVVHQDEDLGRWVRSVRLCRDNLTTVQQWICERILGITPATDDEKPKWRTSQADKWALNDEAARQYYHREGHLRVPRKHTERIIIGGEGGAEVPEERELRLGAWISNQRSRAAMLSERPARATVRHRHALVVMGHHRHRGRRARGRPPTQAAAPVAASG